MTCGLTTISITLQRTQHPSVLARTMGEVHQIQGGCLHSNASQPCVLHRCRQTQRSNAHVQRVWCNANTQRWAWDKVFAQVSHHCPHPRTAALAAKRTHRYFNRCLTLIHQYAPGLRGHAPAYISPCRTKRRGWSIRQLAKSSRAAHLSARQEQRTSTRRAGEEHRESMERT